jgi:activating signal cointegrator 1
MKSITICVPYPSLILLPESDQHHKRVENRNWSTSYRGPLLIHSGKSKKWMGSYNEDVEAYLPVYLGMIVGVVDMLDCVKINTSPLDEWIAQEANRRFPWLCRHKHASGPYCHIYANVRRFVEPIPYRGAQGFFDVPDTLVAKAVESAVVI